MKLLFASAAVLTWLATGVLATAPPPLNKAVPVSNHFIVQYNDDVSAADRQKHEALLHATVSRHTKYRGIMKTFSIGSFQGYHVEIDAQSVRDLQAANIIKTVIPDARISINAAIPSTSRVLIPRDGDLPPGSDIRVMPAATWGQSRLSHRNSGSSGFVYQRGGSTAYVIDTGIRVTHEEFLDPTNATTRAIWGKNFLDANTVDTDENGHGTHVAGTIGGRTLGIAPETELIACKVFDANGGGPWSGVLAAMDWAVKDAVAKNRVGRSVINMSLGGGKFQPVDDAVTAAVNAGITVVVAAGNTGDLVKNISPAGNADAITVGAIYDDDSRAEWSNYGDGLDVFAPGYAIKSAWIDSDTATREESGTSMACPHVAGLVAYLMEIFGPHTPAQMRDRVNGLATMGKVTGAGDGSANAIAYNGNEMFL